MTSEEILKTLRHCDCGECEQCLLNDDWSRCRERLLNAAAELIERLEKEKAALLKFTMENTGCDQCKHYDPSCDAVDCVSCEKECACASCKKGSKWEWKGVEGEEG